MTAVSIVYAHRAPADNWRAQCAAWVFDRAQRLWPEVERVGGDSGETPFNHAASFNDGAARASGDVLMLMDSDTTVDMATMLVAVDHVTEHGGWVMAERYVKLDEDTTARLLAGNPCVDLDAMHSWGHLGTEWEGTTSWAGFVVIRAADFHAIGGYDARLSGWAPDDIAFGLTASALIGDPVRVPGSVFHLWHEPSFEAEHGWTDEKHALKNAYLAAAYDPEAIRRVMEGKP